MMSSGIISSRARVRLTCRHYMYTRAKYWSVAICVGKIIAIDFNRFSHNLWGVYNIHEHAVRHEGM